MKKIFSIAMAVGVLFAMISCDNGTTPPPGPQTGDKVTITYKANGWEGESIPGPVTDKVVGDAIGIDNLPTLSHDADTQKFLGWSLTEGQAGAKVGADYVLQGDTTLYALWQAQVEVGEPITITYDANGWTGGGVPTDPVSSKSGDAIGAENLPVLTDTETQIFLGWSQTAGQAGLLVTANTALYGDTTLYVRYTTPITLTFDYNGPTDVTAPASVKVGSGAAIGDVLPEVEADPETDEALIYPTYLFLGWFTAASGGTAVTEDSEFTEDTTLYAQWESLPDWVFFEMDLEWVPYTQSMAGTQWPAELPEATYTDDPETGKKVLHWKFTQNAQRGLIMFSPGQRKLMEIPELEGFRMWIDGEIAEGQTAADQWRMFIVNPFATADWQGTNAVGGQAAFSTLLDNNIVWMGNRFKESVGGDSDPATDGPENYRTQAILIQHRVAGDADVTIRSIKIRYDGKVSAAPPPAFKVEFDLNYENAPEKTVTFKLVDVGGAIGRLPTATRPAFVFDGWYLEDTGVTPVEETTTFNAASTVYAKWEALPPVNISYDWNYTGAPAAPATITIGAGEPIGAENLPDPDPLTRPTHVFNGWFTAATGGTLVTADWYSNTDATLYGQWSTPPTLPETWAEKIVSVDASGPVYGFNIGTNTFGDYDTIKVKIKAELTNQRLRSWGPHTSWADPSVDNPVDLGNATPGGLLLTTGYKDGLTQAETEDWVQYEIPFSNRNTLTAADAIKATTGIILLTFAPVPQGGTSGVTNTWYVKDIELADSTNAKDPVPALHPQSHLLWKGQGDTAFARQQGSGPVTRELIDITVYPTDWEEKITMVNTSVPVYGFNLPAGKTFGDYTKIVLKMKFDPDSPAKNARLRAWGNYDLSTWTTVTGRPSMGNASPGGLLLNTAGEVDYAAVTEWTEYTIEFGNRDTLTTATDIKAASGIVAIGIGAVPPGGGSGTRIFYFKDIVLSNTDGSETVPALYPSHSLLWNGQGASAYVTQDPSSDSVTRELQ